MSGEKKPLSPGPNHNKKKKKNSPWISNKEVKRLTANAALPLVNEQAYDYGDKLDPQLFYSWGGQHSTPPIWDERPVYKDRNLQKTIGQWRSNIPQDKKPFGNVSNKMASSLVDPHSTNFSFWVRECVATGGHLYFLPPDHDISLMAEIVPRAWIPCNFESGHDLESFWQQQMKGAPRPQDECDFGDGRPFWDRYLVPYAAVQPFPTQPDQEGYDTSQDTLEEKKLRENDQGSQGWTNQYLQNPNAFMMTHFARKAGSGGGRRRDDEPTKEASFIQETPLIDNTIKPALNLFVRMAQLGDIPQITDIYNHYVQHSVCTPELDPISIIDMKGRWESARSGHLPFLVACSLVGYGGRKRFKDRPAIDTIIGFAFADDVCGPRTAVRFTVEVGLFVDASRRFAHGGASKCLMDKLLNLLDQFYIERGGYEIDYQLGLGAQRLVSRIMLNYMHSKIDDTKDWVIPYLESWGFKQKTTLEGFGYKLNRVVDNTVFYRETGLVVAPNNPPIPPPREG